MYINRSSILVPKLAHNVAFFCGNQGLDLLSLPGFPARANTTVDSAVRSNNGGPSRGCSLEVPCPLLPAGQPSEVE